VDRASASGAEGRGFESRRARHASSPIRLQSHQSPGDPSSWHDYDVEVRFTIHPELPASDIRRAQRWYAEKLGLEPAEVGGEPFTPGRSIPEEAELLYRSGSATFGVYSSEHAGRNQATAARLVVDDFEATFSELRSRGVVFEDYDLGPDFRTVGGVLVSPDGERTAWFKDSEGNILALGSST
jgi:catechol 2,3-dioxygenase-like lactoylglutathione lyase family enzyme